MRLLLTAALLSGATSAALAQSFPTRPVRFVVPYAAGGPADIVARLVTPGLSSQLGQPVVIENRAGAGGHVGAAEVVRTSSDGHVIILTTIAHNAAHSMYVGLSYDPARDIRPVVVLADAPSVLVVHPSLPVKSVQSLVALARANPGKLAYGSAGSGSALHMAAELFRMMTRTDIMHVPYKGSAPASADLMGGQIHMMFDSFPSAIPHVRSGRLRALAVTSARRALSLPDLPTVAEGGLQGYESVPWYSISVPTVVPEAAVRRLNEAANAALKSPDLVPRWADLGLTPLGGSPEDAVRRNEVETARWSEVIRAAGIKVQ